jgi:hypothetical protein
MFLQENHEVDPIRVVPLTYTKSTLKNIYQTFVHIYALSIYF